MKQPHSFTRLRQIALALSFTTALAWPSLAQAASRTTPEAPDLQRMMILRHQLTKSVRDYFDEHKFLEIETPILGRSRRLMSQTISARSSAVTACPSSQVLMLSA